MAGGDRGEDVACLTGMLFFVVEGRIVITRAVLRACIFPTDFLKIVPARFMEAPCRIPR